MIPKTSILETHFGKYMVWQSDGALFKRLAEIHVTRKDESLVQASKAIVEILQNYSHNKVVLDIGANAGSYSIPQAIQFPGVQFFCFEVQRLVYYQLCGNIFLNSLDNVFTYHVAIGNENRYIDIPVIADYSQVNNVGGYTLDSEALKNIRKMSSNEILKSNKTTKIALRTIDSMRELPLAGLIKIDVEGQELEVLIGAENYIKRSGYPPIFFEAWNYFWHQEKKNNLLNYLKDIGYDFFENFFDGNILAQSSKTAKVLLNFNKQKDGITIQQSIKK